MDVDQTIKQLMHDLNRAEENKDLWEKEFTLLEDKYAALDKDNADLREHKAKLIGLVEKQDREYRDLEDENIQLRHQIHQMEIALQSVKPNQDLTTEINQLHQKVAEKDELLCSLRLRLEEEAETFEKNLQESSTKHSEIAELKSIINNLEQTLSSYEAQVETLIEELDTFRNDSSRSLSVDLNHRYLVLTEDKDCQTDISDSSQDGKVLPRETPIGTRYGRPSLASELKNTHIDSPTNYVNRTPLGSFFHKTPKSVQQNGDSAEEPSSDNPLMENVSEKPLLQRFDEEDPLVVEREKSEESAEETSIVVSHTEEPKKPSGMKKPGARLINGSHFVEAIFWIGLYLLLDYASKTFLGVPLFSAEERNPHYRSVF